MHDLMKPDRSRVLRILSALINFQKFKRDKLAWYEELEAKKVRSGGGGGGTHTSVCGGETVGGHGPNDWNRRLPITLLDNFTHTLPLVFVYAFPPLFILAG